MPLIKCWECGKEVSDSAKSCPSCGANPKKIKLNLPLIAKLLLLGVILYCATYLYQELSLKVENSNGSSKDVSTINEVKQRIAALNENNKTKRATTQSIKPNLPTTIIKKIGENYTLGDMDYKVISAINKGAKYEYQTTTGKFIFVKILVSNTGKIKSKESVVIIKDINDRQFSSKDYFYLGYNSGLKLYYFNMFDEGMAPGFSETYTAVFEVAKDSSGLKLCHPSTTGIDLVCVKLAI